MVIHPDPVLYQCKLSRSVSLYMDTFSCHWEIDNDLWNMSHETSVSLRVEMSETHARVGLHLDQRVLLCCFLNRLESKSNKNKNWLVILWNVFQRNTKIKISSLYVVAYCPVAEDANRHEENSGARLMSVVLIKLTIPPHMTLASWI